ncbi:MAG: hypothetical protein NZ810_07905 [Dehalococcoidia bacterium]|nr:hypothetical protein [Dehalococcoidia bacterium]
MVYIGSDDGHVYALE